MSDYNFTDTRGKKQKKYDCKNACFSKSRALMVKAYWPKAFTGVREEGPGQWFPTEVQEIKTVPRFLVIL